MRGFESKPDTDYPVETGLDSQVDLVEELEDLSQEEREKIREMHREVEGRLAKVNESVQKHVRFFAEAEQGLEDFVARSPQMKSHVYAMADKYEVPAALVFAVMYFESRFDVNARKGGMSGLGQISPATWTEFKKKSGYSAEELKVMDLMDPEVNVEVVAWYLGKQAKALDFKPSFVAGFAQVYEAYHGGLGGYRNLQKFRWREGEAENENFNIPAGYRDVTFSQYGITIEDYEDYAEVSGRMGRDVQRLTRLYEDALWNINSEEAKKIEAKEGQAKLLTSNNN
jgi:hypothetical protein